MRPDTFLFLKEKGLGFEPLNALGDGITHSTARDALRVFILDLESRAFDQALLPLHEKVFAPVFLLRLGCWLKIGCRMGSGQYFQEFLLCFPKTFAA